MGGHTLTIEGYDLVGLFEKLMQSSKYIEEHKIFVLEGMEYLQLSSITIMFKQDDGKWLSLGENKIERAIGMAYNKEPKKRWVMFTYWE